MIEVMLDADADGGQVLLFPEQTTVRPASKPAVLWKLVRGVTPAISAHWVDPNFLRIGWRMDPCVCVTGE